MTVWEIIGGVVMILTSVFIVVLVGLQEGTKGGLGAVAGGDSYYNKNQGRSRDAMLARATKFAAVFFFVVTILVYAATVYLK